MSVDRKAVQFLSFMAGKAQLVPADCFEWLEQREACSIHAVVTDPPYGLIEYTEKEQQKLRKGRGGVWRIPPSFDGHQRAPLPRFTVLDDDDRKALHAFFKRLSAALLRVTVPGANVVVASNPLLSHIRCWGNDRRRVRTARPSRPPDHDDARRHRPKNAHHEFDGVSVMPRSMWEPWVVFRKPPDGRVQDNLRKWRTGGFRRPNKEQPFGDVLRSNPTARAERQIAPHPSLKPQEFLRKVVRAILPLGEGVVLDPFAGSGSTLAAANAVGYESIGIEKDPAYFQMAAKAISALARIRVNDASSGPVRRGGKSAAAEGPKFNAHQKGG